MGERSDLMIGYMGRSWPLDFRPTEPAHAGSLGGWLVDVPWCHPIWPQHVFLLVHLRPIEGTRPPSITLPGASHELTVLAVKPDDQVTPDMSFADGRRIAYLAPPDQVVQFIIGSDAEAVARVEAAIAECIAGRLSCDSDYRGVFTFFMQNGMPGRPPPVSEGTATLQ